VHSQSKCESSKNLSQGCYFEDIVSSEVFEKRKFFILWICLRVRMDLEIGRFREWNIFSRAERFSADRARCISTFIETL
jgi:hypothetical protein